MSSKAGSKGAKSAKGGGKVGKSAGAKTKAAPKSKDTSIPQDDNFETASAEASVTYPKQCSALRKNEYVVIKDIACKIVEMSTSKTGKHGHAKVLFKYC